ncbi:nucleotide exchange factor GrpE [Desulforudis sp. 1088]|uniref:nucleotide exchange factor GrpE n=1 Tax=unclassified Candidatus Desulforudis TaxID=2635950 RepID=UPI003CE5C211
MRNDREKTLDKSEQALAAQPEAEQEEAGREEAGCEERLNEEKLRAEEYYERMLRLQADFDNYRRRTRKEKEEWFRQAVEDTVKSLLPVLDNFSRALEAPGEDVQSLRKGVEMIKRQLEDALVQMGLEPIDSLGKEFDPAEHEAVEQDFGSGEPENTVVAELRKGYKLKGKVIRPAMVKVSKNN